MQSTQLNYVDARLAVLDGKKASRSQWECGKIIRMSNEADYDYVGNIDLTGIIMQECSEPQCDSCIGVYHMETEDTIAEDWFIIEEN